MRFASPKRRHRAAWLTATLLATQVADVAGAAPSLETRADAAAKAVIARTGVPSASIALVRDGKLVYANAYGFSDLEAKRQATPAMRYAIGSISKEFTAAALLMLQEDGKLSVDDGAGKWLDGLGPAGGTSIRSLLSHTSGVRDFWPQDYDPPEMLKPVQADAIIARWAAQPLDFETGSRWQYSNTGYTIAGLIAEKAGGEPLFAQMRRRIFEPLGMASVVDFDAGPLPDGDATGYMRYALGPPRRAAKEGKGWLFAAGPLAMTASDLAKWDIALIERRLLKPGSYRDLTTEVVLTNGVGSGYALGLDVALESDRRMLAHGGEVGGFTAENRIFPDDGAAIVVQVNQDATDASERIAIDLEKLLFVDDSPAAANAVARARRLFDELREGRIDERELTDNARSYFTPRALADFRTSLRPLGKPGSFELVRTNRRGGFVTRLYDVGFAGRNLRIVERSEPEGRVEQFTISAK